MTETETPLEVAKIVRSFDAELEAGAGRTIVGRLVPYGVPADVADAGGIPYREQIARGAFRRAARAPHRYWLNWEHREGILDQIARGSALTEADDGLDGEFVAVDGLVGDQALAMIRSAAEAGEPLGLSIQARIPPRTSRTLDDGTIERTLAILEHVALTTEPAYAGAAVTAIRSSSGRYPEIEAVRARQAELRLRSRPTT